MPKLHQMRWIFCALLNFVVSTVSEDGVCEDASCDAVSLIQSGFSKRAHSPGSLDRSYHQSLPFEPFQVPDVSIQPSLPLAQTYDGFLTMAYHKTGSVFGRSLHNAISDVPIELPSSNPNGWEFDIDWDAFMVVPDRFSAGLFWKEHYNEAKHHGRYQIEGVSSEFTLPDRMNAIHWYRDPVSLVLSAYRYHSGLTRNDTVAFLGEHWAFVNGKCAWCDQQSLDLIFGQCQYSCKYPELLRSLDAEEGVQTELIHSSLSIRSMLANLGRWANEPQMLMLSMQHLEVNFNQTMQCMLQFLGVQDASERAAMIQDLQYIDENSPAYEDPMETLGHTHSTSGLFDNAQLEEILESSPLLSKVLPAVRSMVSQIYERQASMYGCPVP